MFCEGIWLYLLALDVVDGSNFWLDSPVWGFGSIDRGSTESDNNPSIGIAEEDVTCSGVTMCGTSEGELDPEQD